MKEYMLEVAEPIILKTELTKNRTHQTWRWKQVAMCDELEPLKAMLKPYMRIVDKNCNIVVKHTRQY